MSDIIYPIEFYREFKNKTRNIVFGDKTVGITEVELCANVTPLTNRIRLKFYIEGDYPVYIGNSGVDTASGYVILPGRENEEEFIFDPEEIVNIYAIAENEVTVKISEEA